MARILGIDYGTKRIGLALTDELRMFASPFDTQQNTPEFWNYLEKIVHDYRIDAFVLGKPSHDGENSFLPVVLEFAAKLYQKFSFDIYLYDESLSSQDARAHLIASGKRGKKLKEKLDQYAAQAILSSFLQSYERGIIERYEPEC